MLASERLTKIQSLMGLIPKLNKKIQGYVTESMPLLRNLVCTLLSLTYFQEHHHALWDDESPEFHDILDFYQLSLKEIRKNGKLSQKTSTLLWIAKLYFYAAESLRPNAVELFSKTLDAADLAFQKIRNR